MSNDKPNQRRANGTARSREGTGWGAKVAGLTVSVVLAVAAFEVLPRLAPSWMPAKIRSVVRLYDARNTWEKMMRPSKEFGFSLQPDLNLEFPSEGRAIKVRTIPSGVDHVGMRDIGTHPPFDAVAVGDSFTFCDDSPAEECWVRILSDRTGLSIATLGVNGYSNLAEARMLRTVGASFAPRLVLVGFFPNDFKDNLHFDNWTRSDTDDYWTWMRRKRRSDLSEFLARHSILYRLVDAARRYGKRDTFHYAENGLRFTFRADAWWRTVVEKPGGTPGFRLTTEALRDMKKQAGAMNAKLLVLLFPFKEQVYWSIAERFQPPSQHFSRAQVDAPFKAVKAFCDAAGIHCCDLTAPMRKRARAGQQLYLDVGAHWNAQGNKAAAAITEDCLEENFPGTTKRAVHASL